jgi:transposase InsO family protein
MAARQATCADVQAAKSLPSLSVQFREVNGVLLLCDTSGGRWRPLVPVEDRKAVFSAIHDVAHPGIRATRRLVTARFLWPSMRSDIAAWCRDCVGCNRAKAGQQHTAKVQPIAIPQRRFSHVHVDLVGPLPVAADGSTYLLTVIDRTTRWLEAVPLKNMAAGTCTDAFLGTWVSRFGVPETITTDRGTQFTSDAWQELCTKLGSRHVTTTAYHPQSNGLVERAHRQLKDALRARQTGPDWPQHLPWALLGLRAAPKEIRGLSSAEAVFGQQLTLPGTLQHVPEALPDDMMVRMASEDPPPTVQPRTWAEVAAKNVQPALYLSPLVYVRRGGVAHALDSKYVGPYRVLRRKEKTFIILVGDREEEVSVDRLKPHQGTSPLQPAVPPSRGRPRIFKPP